MTEQAEHNDHLVTFLRERVPSDGDFSAAMRERATADLLGHSQEEIAAHLGRVYESLLASDDRLVATTNRANDLDGAYAAIVRERNELRDELGQAQTRVAELGVERTTTAAALDSERRDHAATRQAHEAWKEELITAAHAEADRREWCGDFDDWMERIGLRGRQRDWEVEVQVTMNVRVTISAINAAQAEEQVSTDQLEQAVYDLARYEIDVDEYEVRDVEVID